uniref:Ig-like domain-containing protein n=1 Tax=Pelodiscus sinensis TaxID=13735 RepID=K7GDE0_PELSI
SHGVALSAFTAGPTSPSVFPLTSCVGEATTSQVTFGCLVKDYTPEPVTVQWSPSVSASGLRTYPSMLQTSSGLYSLSSQVTVPASSRESNTYRCTVGHQPTRSSITKEIPSRKLPAPNPTHPRCKSTTPPAPPSQAPSTCSASSPTSPPCPYVSTSTSNILVFMVPPSPAEPSPKVQSNILIFMVPPPPSELYVGLSPTLTCLVVNLPNDADLKVVWSREKSGTISPEPLVLSEQRNRTFTASSSLAIFPRDWETGDKYSCKVEHSELPSPIIKSISKSQGKSSPPNVYLLRPHHDELNGNSNGDTVSITCLVRGFYPEDISVKWMEDHQPSDNNKSVTTSPMKEGAGGDSTYFLYSKLTVDKASWKKGTTFTCMVIHEALKPMKFTQRNIHILPVLGVCDFCNEDGDEDLDSLWSTISVFITLFLLSVCYSATVTLFKVKWLFSTVVQLKRANGPEYKNVIQRVV